MAHSNSPAPSAGASSFAQELLHLAHPTNPAKASQIFTDKIHRRPFPLRPTEKSAPPTAATKATAPQQEQKTKLDNRTIRRIAREKKHARRYTSHKPKPLSAKERRARGLHEIPKEARRYELYEGLHKLWVGYMQEILAGTLSSSVREATNKTANSGTAARVSAADLHGCLMEVVRSRCPSRVGVKGIVVKETKMTFFIVTRKDEVKSIPKEHSIFRFEVPYPSKDGEGDAKMTDASGTEGKEEVVTKPMVFELHGSNFLHRSSERANKKWKAKPMTDL